MGPFLGNCHPSPAHPQVPCAGAARRCASAQRHLAGWARGRAWPILPRTVQLALRCVPESRRPRTLPVYVQRVWGPFGESVTAPGFRGALGRMAANTPEVPHPQHRHTLCRSYPSSGRKRPLIWKSSQVVVGKLKGTYGCPPPPHRR